MCSDEHASSGVYAMSETTRTASGACSVHLRLTLGAQGQLAQCIAGSEISRLGAFGEVRHPDAANHSSLGAPHVED
jgi:hypothetical protein